MPGFYAEAADYHLGLDLKYEAAAEGGRRLLRESGIDLDRIAAGAPAPTVPAPLPVAAPPAASSAVLAPQATPAATPLAPAAAPPAQDPRPSGLALAVQDMLRRDGQATAPAQTAAPKSGLAKAVAEMNAREAKRWP